MGSSQALLCAISIVLVFLSSASKDERIHEQREITSDLGQKMQDLHEDDSFIMQRPLDLSEIFDLADLPSQVMTPDEAFLTNDGGSSRPRPVPPSGRRPSFGPRSFPSSYSVEFPLGQPSSDNLQAICQNADHRPLYPDSYFPLSGYGQQKRMASAVNRAESWFRMCCEGNQTWGGEVTMCCATQAWELSLETFCEESSRVKDYYPHCCRKSGNERLSCFHKDSPNPNYESTLELPVPPLPSIDGFSFDPNTCQRTGMTPQSVRGKRKMKKEKSATSKKPDINFPPGRPTADTIESLCHNQKLRPLYTVKCLPGSGYELLARQAKTVNRIEKGFKQCCRKKDALKCADQKWREELNRFCVGVKGAPVDFLCCSAGEEGDNRYSCFQSFSPDPHYNMTSATKELSLSKICDTHKIIKKKFSIGGFPLKTFVNRCCPLSEAEKPSCFAQMLKEKSEKLCSAKKASPPPVRRCCREPSQEAQQCISNIVMDAVTKATNVLNQKKKRCPLS